MDTKEAGAARQGLQNHPGEQTFPAGFQPARWRQALEATPVGACCMLGATVYGMAIGWCWLSKTRMPLPLPWGLAPGVLLAGVAMALAWRVLCRQRAEQRRYYALTAMPALTDAQQAALALDGFNVYGSGMWGHTLEFEPCERRLRDAGRAQARFTWLGVKSMAEERRALEDWWGVRTAAQAEAMVHELFAGMHSVQFAEEGADDHALATYLAERMHVPEERVVRLLYPQGGMSPQLVLGFDWWRAVHFTRCCYMADLVDERRAWGWILRADALARGLFETQEAFLFSLRVGHAYWSRNTEEIAGRGAMIEDYVRHCTWPVARIPWQAVEG